MKNMEGSNENVEIENPIITHYSKGFKIKSDGKLLFSVMKTDKHLVTKQDIINKLEAEILRLRNQDVVLKDYNYSINGDLSHTMRD